MASHNGLHSGFSPSGPKLKSRLLSLFSETIYELINLEQELTVQSLIVDITSAGLWQAYCMTGVSSGSLGYRLGYLNETFWLLGLIFDTYSRLFYFGSHLVSALEGLVLSQLRPLYGVSPKMLLLSLNSIMCQCWDSNLRSLVWDGTALPSALQPQLLPSSSQPV